MYASHLLLPVNTTKLAASKLTASQPSTGQMWLELKMKVDQNKSQNTAAASLRHRQLQCGSCICALFCVCVEPRWCRVTASGTLLDDRQAGSRSPFSGSAASLSGSRPPLQNFFFFLVTFTISLKGMKSFQPRQVSRTTLGSLYELAGALRFIHGSGNNLL